MMLFLVLGAPDGDSDARAALALASALPRQAPLPPQAPAADCPRPEHSHGVYEWRPFDDDAGQIALYLNGKQVGGYSYRHQGYRPLKDGVWGAWGKPPTDVPPREFFAPQSQAPLHLQPFVQGPQFFPQGGAYCPPGASS